jgi:hypothetical protein
VVSSTGTGGSIRRETSAAVAAEAVIPAKAAKTAILMKLMVIFFTQQARAAKVFSGSVRMYLCLVKRELRLIFSFITRSQAPGFKP